MCNNAHYLYRDIPVAILLYLIYEGLHLRSLAFFFTLLHRFVCLRILARDNVISGWRLRRCVSRK